MKRWAIRGLWVAFSVLAGGIGFQLVNACRIEIGQLFRYPLEPGICRGAEPQGENPRVADIRRAVADLERQVSVRQATCSAENSCPVPTSPPAPPVQPPPAPARPPAPREACIPRDSSQPVNSQIAIIVDVTTSMVSSGGNDGLGIVQRHVPQALAALRVPSVHLHWYNQCSRVETRRLPPAEASSMVRSFDPTALSRGINQGEPATLAVSRALQAFEAGQDGKVTGRIVLFTDDRDTCPGNAPLHDICALGSAIARDHPQVRVNLVALGAGATQLACIAERTGGKVWQPGQSNPQELISALSEATQLPVCAD